MKLYISTIGFEKYGNANNIWLATKLKNFIPNRVIILFNDDKKIQEYKKTNISKIKEWFPEIKIEEIKFVEGIKEYKEILTEILKDNSKDEIAIDVTLGRKYMGIIATHLAIKHKIKNIFYTLYDDQYHNKPITQIPITKVKLINFVDE